MELDLQRDLSAPLYLRLTSELRRQVKNGGLKPGDRLPTFSELRARYGLHKNTVERAHMLLEQEGLVIREHGRGIFVADGHNGADKSIQGGQGLIALCGAGFLSSRSSPYWSKLLEGLWAGFGSDGEDHSPQLLLLEQCSPEVAGKADGILINASWHEGERAEVPPGLPAVSLLIQNQVCEIDSVVADDYAGSRAAARHLLELGHRRIGYLCGGEDRVILPRRLAGYRDALQEFGVTPQPGWVRRWKKESPQIEFVAIGYEQMAQWIHEGWTELGCTALLALNDETAIGVIRALEESGSGVPEDVSVMGFDGTDLGDLSQVRLSTIEVPLREIGKTAMALLLRKMREGTGDVEHVTLPAMLRIGETTAAAKKA